LCIHSVDFWQKLAEVVDGLAADGRLLLKPLVTHVLGFEEAGEAFRLLDEDPGEAVQVVLEF
jgi:threonine dehydrogenase-like Zn-dependent dehydrogenase